MEIILRKLEDIEAFMMRQIILSKEVLTLEEAGFYLGMSKSNLYKLTSKREISFYSPGGKKIYFKRSEIEAWVLCSNVATTSKIGTEVESYLSRTSKISAL